MSSGSVATLPMHLWGVLRPGGCGGEAGVPAVGLEIPFSPRVNTSPSPCWWFLICGVPGTAHPGFTGNAVSRSLTSFSVELLAYKVEQEKRIASDVQKTLNEEQEKASSVRKLLVVEQTVVRDLRSELRECKQDNERLLASLSEAQKEVLQLR